MRTINHRDKVIRHQKNYETFKSKFLSDIPTKLICFLIAAVMYIIVSFYQRSEKIIYKPISILGLKNTITIASTVPDKVAIKIRDRKKVLDAITDDMIKVELDLTEYTQVTGEKISVNFKYDTPSNLKSIFSSMTLYPEKLDIQLDYIKEKSVPIVISTLGDINTKFMIKEKRLFPSEVRIQGPSTILNTIDHIETEKINLADETKSFERIVKLDPKNSKIKLLGNQEINVFIEITEKNSSNILKINNIVYTKLSPKFRIIAENLPISLSLSGNVKNISPEEIVVSLDCSNIKNRGYHSVQDINFTLPSGYNIESYSPKSIIVYVSEIDN